MNRSTVALSTSLWRRLAFLPASILLVSTVAFLVTAPDAAAQKGARVRQRNLAEMVGDSNTIILGRVLSLRAEKHPQYPGLDTVVVKLQVEEVLKGEPTSEFTFRQYVWDKEDASGMLGYRIGQEVLLLLIPPSEAGLSSPAGMEQGRFRVSRDSQGNRLVANGFNNAGLFRRMTTSKLESRVGTGAQRMVNENRVGAVAYDDLRAVIRALVEDRAN